MKRILLVDDEKDMLDLTVPMLTANHFEVVAVSSGEEALKQAAASSPDLILLDLMMPSMDGHETLKLLKENNKTGSIPVLMLTAIGKADSVSRSLELGAIDYIAKPFEPKTLLEKIRKALQ